MARQAKPAQIESSSGMAWRCMLRPPQTVKHRLVKTEFKSRTIQFCVPSLKVNQVPKSSAAELGPTGFSVQYECGP